MRMNSYIMHESYIDAIDELSRWDQLAMFWGIANYAMYDVEPEFDGVLKAIFAGMRKQIEFDKKRYLAAVEKRNQTR